MTDFEEHGDRCPACAARRRKAQIDADMNNVETYEGASHPSAVWPPSEEQR